MSNNNSSGNSNFLFLVNMMKEGVGVFNQELISAKRMLIRVDGRLNLNSNYIDLAVYPLKLISAVLVFKTVVNLYMKHSYPAGTTYLSLIKQVARGRIVRKFMVFTALPLTLFLISLGGSSLVIVLFEGIKLNFQGDSDIISSMLPFFLASGKIRN